MLPLPFEFTEETIYQIGIKEYLGPESDQDDFIWPDEDAPCFLDEPHMPCTPVETLIEKYGTLKDLGLERRESTEEELENFNSKRLAGLELCNCEFNGFSPKPLYMLLGEFSLIDVWVDAGLNAARFSGSQHLSGFSFSDEKLFDYTERDFYRTLDAIHNEAEKLAELKIICINVVV